MNAKRNPMARALAQGQYKPKVIPDKRHKLVLKATKHFTLEYCGGKFNLKVTL